MKTKNKVVAEITEKLERLTAIKQHINKIEVKLARDCAPAVAAYEEAVNPLKDAANKKLQPLKAEFDQLTTEVENLLIVNGVREGKILVPEVEAGIFKVVINRREGDREVHPKTLLEAVPEKDRDDNFWACFKVQVAKVKAAIGENRLNQIAVRVPIFKALLTPVE